MMDHTRQRRIALLASGSSDYRREIRRGVGRFARTRPEVETVVGGETGEWIEWLAAQSVDGVISQVARPALRDYLRSRHDLAIVNISGWFDDVGLPTIAPDDEAIGRAAATYLLELGYRRLGNVGLPTPAFSAKRGRAFTQTCLDADAVVADFLTDVDATSHPDRAWGTRWLSRWLADLPRPVAVFAHSDERGRDVIRLCQEAGLTVPYDVAVLGVNDDELVCELTDPALSSVNIHLNRLGYEAASRVAAQLEGRDRLPDRLLLPPTGVTERPSTMAVATDDPVVARALRFIRDHSGEPFTVDDLLDDLGVSRRSLELKFNKALGQSPWKSIQMAHVRRAERLLVETLMPMSRIAELSGFTSPYQFSVMFKRRTSVSPTAYRQQFIDGGK